MNAQGAAGVLEAIEPVQVGPHDVAELALPFQGIFLNLLNLFPVRRMLLMTE